jgi:hypothetical protein
MTITTLQIEQVIGGKAVYIGQTDTIKTTGEYIDAMAVKGMVAILIAPDRVRIIDRDLKKMRFACHTI